VDLNIRKYVPVPPFLCGIRRRLWGGRWNEKIEKKSVQ
jgi:hypothetical protein